MNLSKTFTSKLGPVIGRYLALKEALGRRYLTERAALTHLDRFLSAQSPKHSRFTGETFALWITTFAHLTPTVRRNRMRIARNLCLYRQRREPTCFIPDPTGFPRPHQPQRPHLFTEQQIARLLDAADQLRPASTSPFYGQGLRLADACLIARRFVPSKGDCPESMTYATPLPLGPCAGGTGMGSMSNPSCPRWQPIWGTCRSFPRNTTWPFSNHSAGRSVNASPRTARPS